MKVCVVCLLLIQATAASVLAPIEKIVNKYDENSVEKMVIPNAAPEYTGDPHLIEAFYYGIYGDLMSNETELFGRPGEASTTRSCDVVRQVPDVVREAELLDVNGLHSFYQKYTEAYGIPVLGSIRVSEKALRRACYVLRFLLADRADLRQRFYAAQGRVVVMGEGENIKSMPEYSFLPGAYSKDTPGLGGIPIVPISSAMEKNIRCDPEDPYWNEDILIREMAQGLHHLAAKSVIPNFEAGLQQLYERAIASGWWRNTYAAHSVDAYFGEGIQSYFSVNGYSRHTDGEHGPVNTRTKLRSYDPELYFFIEQLFPCGNYYIKRCRSRDHENYQNLRMDCPYQYLS